MQTRSRQRLTRRPWQPRTVRRAVVPVSLPALVERHAPALAETGANDAKHFPRIEAALYVSCPLTGRGVHLDREQERAMHRALADAADRGDTDAASVYHRLTCC